MKFKEWLISEIKDEVADDLHQWLDDNPDKLPFQHLFKKGELREVIPFDKDQIAGSLFEKLEKQGDIDFKNGTFIREGSKQSMKLGRFIFDKRSGFTTDEKGWWIRQGNPIESLHTFSQHDQYRLIISRSPIDVVRMSDHDGITSCHDPDYGSNNYFHCARADAKGAGLIAYVIHKEDLKGLDLQAPEIFKDRDRDVHGIKPLARLRLRKFVHQGDDYELAIPEDSIYGKRNIPGFEDAVMNWARTSQKDILDTRPRLKDFHLMGGSYQDTKAGRLFNNFFDDDKEDNSDDATYAGGEEADMLRQYEQEANEISEAHKDSFEFCHFWQDVDESDGMPYVNYSGGFTITFPENIDLNIPVVNDWAKEREIKKKITDWFKKEHYIYIEELDIENEREFRFYLNKEGELTPDGFREFLENDLMDVEKKKDELIGGLYQYLASLGWAKPNKVAHIVNNWDNHEHQFKNFEWEEVISHAMVSMIKPIDLGVSAMKLANIDVNMFHDKFKRYVFGDLHAWANRVAKEVERQKLLFKDPEKSFKPFSGEFKIKPNILIDRAGHDFDANLVFKMSIDFEPLADDELVNDAIQFVSFLDRNYDKFALLVKNLYVNMLNDELIPRNPLPDKFAAPNLGN